MKFFKNLDTGLADWCDKHEDFCAVILLLLAGVTGFIGVILFVGIVDYIHDHFGFIGFAPIAILALGLCVFRLWKRGKKINEVRHQSS